MAIESDFEEWQRQLWKGITEAYGAPSSLRVFGPTLHYGSVIRGKVSGTTMMVVREEMEQAGWTAIVIEPSTRLGFRHRVGQRFTVVDIDHYEVLEA